MVLETATAGIGTGSQALSIATGTSPLTTAQLSNPVAISPDSKIQLLLSPVSIVGSTINVTDTVHDSEAPNASISSSTIR